MNRKEHWENIYSNKELTEVSWYQPNPEFSLHLIFKLIDKNDSIIDIGGGDSFLVDYLLNEGFTDLTVLDISENAIKRAQKRLGEQADKVTWIVSDITEFRPTKQYRLWYDRAAFHFLKNADEVALYKEILEKSVIDNGHAIIGAFSDSGPLKCSGIEIQQYSKEDFTNLFEGTSVISKEIINVDHNTPFETVQNFNFACYQKLS